MIAIVTDSSAHLSREEARALGITVVPMSYSLDGRMIYSERYIDQDGPFEKLVREKIGRLRTSQATFSAFISVFDDLIEGGAEVLCLTISSRLSGTYGNARLAAQEVAPEKIIVLDSLTTSGGLYLLARAASRMARQGLGARDIARAIRRMRDYVNIVFSVDDMGPLRRSGRLSGVRMSISTILNLRPLLQCVDGCIVSVGVVRGRQEQLRTLQNSMPDEVSECVVEHFDAGEKARALSDRLSRSGKSALCRKIGPVLGIHLGAGCVGVAWLDERGLNKAWLDQGTRQDGQ